eukprot:TRINITY_DN589_c0_g1_i1.p2 TRINITY_DN589_c0_g1~~TRINITY_DN589_c0_g1_i1.p2  ORF type:complete len:251 (+),score=50.90 TRINITY_DN589_c0_g1_i1:3281-4033(+)
MVEGNQNGSNGSALMERNENMKKNHIWNEAFGRLKQCITSYKELQEGLTNEILAIGDDKHDIDSKRSEDIEDLEQKNQFWIKARQKVEEEVNENSSLQEQQRAIEDLEQLKRDLVDALVKGNNENLELQDKVRGLGGPMQHLEHFNHHVYQKEHSEVPTKKFTLKVLKLLSAAYLQEDGDSQVFKGFFTNPKTNDVIPFKYTEEMPEVDRVEEVWNILSTISEVESKNGLQVKTRHSWEESADLQSMRGA